MEGSTRAKLTDVNPHLVCVLCHGYLVDATTIAECLHSFCRSCIFRHLERTSICPICRTPVNSTKLHLNLKPDKTLQDIVYKLVPGLFRNEMLRRREFYKKHPFRDEYLEPECRGVGRDRVIYSPDDLISLSLEFYDEETEREEWNNNHITVKPELTEPAKKRRPKNGDTKRYLQCPAAFKMAHLKKFIRQKYGLSSTCHVDIIYGKEYLPDSYSLMDIAYIYTWKRNEPMRFYYKLPEVLLKKIFAILNNKNGETPALEEAEKKLTVEMKNGDEVVVKEEAKDLPKVTKEPAVEVKIEQPDTGDATQGDSTKLGCLIVDNAEKDGKVKIDVTESDKDKPVEKKNTTIESDKTKTQENPPAVVKTASPTVTKSIPGTPNGPNGFVTKSRQMSKQDELPVSVLLSLSNSHTLPPPAPTPVLSQTPLLKPPPHRHELKFILPKPTPTNCFSPRPTVEQVVSKKILSGKLNSRMSVNKIASELAEQNRLNKTTALSSPKLQTPPALFSTPAPIALKPATPADPFAFPAAESSAKTTTNATSQPAAVPTTKPKTNGMTESAPTPKPRTPPPPQPPPPPSAVVTNGVKLEDAPKTDRPEVTVNTSNGSLTISTQPPSKSPPLPQKNALKLNGGSVTVVAEVKKETADPMIQQSNINNRLPTFSKNGPRKKLTPVVPGGVISKTGPTLDQRLQQLYKNNNRLSTSFIPPVKQQSSPPGKQPESRLANWLNNRFPPLAKLPTSPTPSPEITANGLKCDSQPKEAIVGCGTDSDKKTDATKVDTTNPTIKRKLAEFRERNASCEITQENPSPELEKKRRDVKPDVSIEFMRATDVVKKTGPSTTPPPPPPPAAAPLSPSLKKTTTTTPAASAAKEKSLKRPVPALMSIQEVDLKKKCVEDDKTKKPSNGGICGKGEEALDLSGGTACKPTEDNLGKHMNQNGQLSWLFNRPPLMTNQRFLPRSS